jgi:transcriptional regulator with XRE-family HTH domain
MAGSYSDRERAILLALGRQIYALRKARGMSQEELAFHSNLDRAYMGSVERGERNVSLINLQKIAQALNLSLAELFSF